MYFLFTAAVVSTGLRASNKAATGPGGLLSAGAGVAAGCFLQLFDNRKILPCSPLISAAARSH